MKWFLILAAAACGSLAVGKTLHDNWHQAELAPATTYWGNGSPRTSIVYVDGHRHGPCSQWYASGTKECEGQFENGARQGLWSFWREDGSRDEERSGLYERGERVGSAQ